MAVLLTARQRRFLVMRAKLWRPVWAVDSRGRPVGDPLRHERAYSDVPCLFDVTPNLDILTPFGRLRTDNLWVTDTLVLAEGQECGPDWWAQRTDVELDGRQPDNYLLHWRVRGQPMDLGREGWRRINERELYITLEPAPADIRES